MTPVEAARIAEAVAIHRPEWNPKSTLRILLDPDKLTIRRPAQDVACALTWLAYDPSAKTPAVIHTPGMWWRIGHPEQLAEGRKAEKHDRPWSEGDRPCGGTHFRDGPCQPTRPARNWRDHIDEMRSIPEIAGARAARERAQTERAEPSDEGADA